MASAASSAHVTSARLRTPPAAFHAIVHAALARIEGQARGVLGSNDPEYLHQLRVGLRRLRSALRAFRDLLPGKQRKRLARWLRKVSRELGEARDWDVLVQRLEAAPAPPPLLSRARGKRDLARKGARKVLTSKPFAKLLEAARTLDARQSDESLADFAATALDRPYRRLMLSARGIDWSDARERHAVRIRVKRLRYGCECFAPAFPGKATTLYLQALKELQRILGELNDIAVGRRLIGLDDAEEALLLRKLGPAWTRFAKRRPFWRARA